MTSRAANPTMDESRRNSNLRYTLGKLVVCSILGVFLAVSLGETTALRAQTQDNVVAKINGRNVTQREVDESITSQIFPLEQQIYALRKAALENLVSRAILEDAANKRGVSLQELKRQLTSGKIEVSSLEIEQEYTEHASAFGAMSPDEAKERLRLSFESEARMKLYRDAMAELRKYSRIELFLEEPRLLSFGNVGTGPSIGAKDAPVTIMEFSDFQCSFCRGTQSTLKLILQKYRNQVRLVFKHLPLDIHAEAFVSAQAAFCAGEQGFFWQYQDALFASDGLSPEDLKRTASSLGLDLPKFTSCLDSEASRAAILKDIREAHQFGINATPTFIVNGRLVRGAIGLDEFTILIEQELKSTGASSHIQ